MAEEFEFDETRIELLLAQASLIFRRRFIQTIRQIQASFDLGDIEQLIAERRFDEALIQVELAATNLSNAYITAYVLAGEDVFEFIGDSIGIQINFDQVNARAVAQMQVESLRLIREFTEGQRAATRVALVEGVIQGLNPRDMARLFRQSIGLTANQMRAVANFRRLLESNSAAALTRELRDRRFDSSLRRAISGEKPLTAEQIDRMVERYYQRSLAARAETIARTEALGAVHQASDEGFRQAIEAGLIEDELTQKWRTAGDARVREPSHTFMNGQTRPIGEPFRSGTGNLLRYPGDNRAPAHDVVRCRCVKTTRFTADVVENAEA